ncbi:MAG: TadE/TadG family type IV pilus assembly protein [Hyphomicrobium sp.]|uniref:TadE/TadG family type IV pilus assembly protein n=1 Tax=Hyphomicrobium sp. TaxID=82 RepID=UPI0039E52B74
MTIFRKIAAAGRLRTFRNDVKGVAAIEFALLAPLLMMLTFGTIELTHALIVHKRFQRAASMVGDLVTREKQLWPEDKDTSTVTTADAKATMAGIMASVVHVMQPYSTSTLTLRVYQVWANLTDPTQTKIEWSYQYPTQATVGCGTQKTVDSGVLVGNGRAVFIEAQYQFTPLLKNLLPAIIGNSTWSDTMVMTPRDVPSVMYLPGLNNSNTWDSPSTAACQ